MKKILAFVFTVIFVLLLILPCLGLDGKAGFSVSVPKAQISVGDEFPITVSISGNVGFTALSFALTFDPAAFTYVRTELCEMLDDTFAGAGSEDGRALVAAASDKTVGENGDIAKIYFVPKKSGSFDFSIDDTVYSRGTHEPLDFLVTGASLTVLPSGKEIDEPVFPGGEGEKESGGSGNDSRIFPDGGKEDEKGEKDEESEKTEHTFSDTVGHWSEEYVARAVKYGFVKGYSPTLFGPDDKITRVAFAAMLYRLMGSPAVNTDMPFTDMSGEIPEFCDAVAYGYEKGYISGVSETLFCPNDALSRAAAMKMLKGASGDADIGYKMFEAFYTSAFPDSADIPDWGADGIFWGIYSGLISGTNEGKLMPNAPATRAEIAKILVLYSETDTEMRIDR